MPHCCRRSGAVSNAADTAARSPSSSSRTERQGADERQTSTSTVGIIGVWPFSSSGIHAQTDLASSQPLLRSTSTPCRSSRPSNGVLRTITPMFARTYESNVRGTRHASASAPAAPRPGSSDSIAGEGEVAVGIGFLPRGHDDHVHGYQNSATDPPLARPAQSVERPGASSGSAPRRRSHTEAAGMPKFRCRCRNRLPRLRRCLPSSPGRRYDVECFNPSIHNEGHADDADAQL